VAGPAAGRRVHRRVGRPPPERGADAWGSYRYAFVTRDRVGNKAIEPGGTFELRWRRRHPATHSTEPRPARH